MLSEKPTFQQGQRVWYEHVTPDGITVRAVSVVKAVHPRSATIVTYSVRQDRVSVVRVSVAKLIRRDHVSGVDAKLRDAVEGGRI